MKESYLMLPLFFWLFTCGIIFYFDSRLQKKIGCESEGYLYYRLPRFIAIALNSAASIGIMLFIISGPVSPDASTYFVAPYFGIVSYYLACYFRALKEDREKD